ncbi:hypothetical protein ACP3V5_13560 [Vibrio maritimus]
MHSVNTISTDYEDSAMPIPYGNKDESVDLVDCTATVGIDGGNSIAIEDCNFSASKVDARCECSATERR